MVVYPYLLNNNFLLYKDIINPYPPALSYFLGHFSKIFGYYPLPYELFTWAVVILTDILVFILATKITKRFFLGLLSASFFIIFSIPFGINGLWFDIIQTPFILLSIYFFYKFLKDDKTKHLSWSFLLLFVAIFIKQQVAWLMPWYLFFMINCKKFNLAHDFKKILPMLILVTLVSAMHLLFFYKIGTLNEFLFWNINFPLLQASKSPGYILLPTFRQTLVVLSAFLIFLPVLFLKEKHHRFLLFTTVFLILFAYPRFDYFHLIPFLAVISLIVGQVVENFSKISLAVKTVSILSLVFLGSFAARFYLNNWTAEVRFFEREIFDSAVFISNYVPKEEKVYIQNGPDQLLVLSQRLPPKPWADEFSWYLEIGGMQDEIIQGIRMEQTKFIVFKPYEDGGKYTLGSYRPKKIADLIDKDYENMMQISQTLWLKLKYED